MNKVFVQNLAKYNEGSIVGKWLSIPMDEDELHEDIEEIIGEDEEYIITDTESPFEIGAYDSIEEWNYFLKLIEREKISFNVVAMLLDEFDNYEEVISVIENGSIRIFYGVESMEDVAKIIMDDYGYLKDAPGIIERHFDYKSYGEELFKHGNFKLDSENKICVEIFD